MCLNVMYYLETNNQEKKVDLLLTEVVLVSSGTVFDSVF